jgi:hypothetical protein
MIARMLLVTLLAVAGCSGAATSDGGGGSGDMAAATPADMTVYNPRNPTGLGPAMVTIETAAGLGSIGSYVLLAKTGITNVTGSLVTGGALGLSPAAASFITGFSMVADPSNVYSTSVSVASPGKIYAANYADPTPTNLTTVVLAMQTAYTDAAGRSPPDHLNLASGNLGGLTLAPGLYNWGNTVTVPTDVTISGAANDVWIFQIANDLDISAAKSVVLAGGAQAKNIFWQVAGQVTVHANAHLEGIVLSQTAITLQTNATLHGRALAQSLIALDNNAITAP